MKKLEAVKLLRDELVDFSDEVDPSDPEWTQILFNKRVSNLIRKGVVRTKKLPRKVRLTEIVESVLGSKPDDEILERAKESDEMLHSYGDGPAEEEMKAAQNSLLRLIELLDKAIVSGQQKDRK
jgi:hypothetical protein